MTEDFRLKVPSEIKYIKEVSSKVLNALKPYKLDEHKIFDIRLCVEEAVRNAMDHGNNYDKKLSVAVSYRVSNDKLVVDVEDEGGGFDQKCVPDPTKDENMMKSSGRGVLLIMKLMDKVEFNKSGNKIRMTKYLK